MKINYSQIEDFLEVELAQDRITCNLALREIKNTIETLENLKDDKDV